ncbi:hypothetical protein MSU_0581 [Mycoplasma suis str. Illinois]|uniref:Uncharacterized protein n=1 Tax=Mycoplasma suis (strain Illinois) TaxID=768700 RepID=F0QRJ3_MYCSL|nr:hypothetical protein MSU_0581 [Mycoplasma suis str. Illinois]
MSSDSKVCCRRFLNPWSLISSILSLLLLSFSVFSWLSSHSNSSSRISSKVRWSFFFFFNLPKYNFYIPLVFWWIFKEKFLNSIAKIIHFAYSTLFYYF